MMSAARLAAVIVPVLGLAGLWGWSDDLSRQGTEWDVEVQGYDPRDLLRGHYVEFTYDWPEPLNEADDEEAIRFDRGPQLLCLYGAAPALDRAVRIEEDAFDACSHPARANPASVYGLGSLRRGRFYVGQDRAKQIEEEMFDRDQRGIVRIRQRDDGTVTPVSIRFRPLTEDEVAERGDEEDPMEAVVDDAVRAGQAAKIEADENE